MASEWRRRVRANCGATGVDIGDGLCLFISAQDNDLTVDTIRDTEPPDPEAPIPSKPVVEAASRVVSYQRMKRRLGFPPVAADDNFMLVGLSSIEPRIDRNVLYRLPPWRAVAWARVATHMGVMSKAERDGMVNEARHVGGDGELKPWDRRTEREKERGVFGPS